MNELNYQMTANKCIILLGYMCAGKTTVGIPLAKSLNRVFYDLDWYIEGRFRTKISTIFETQGEEKFREMERRMLHEAAEFENIILSCGGGTPCFYDNMAYMNAVAETIYLKASPEVLFEHVLMSRGKRPLLEGKEGGELRAFIEAQLAERAPFYEQARHVIDIDVLDTRGKIRTLTEKIREELRLTIPARGKG